MKKKKLPFDTFQNHFVAILMGQAIGTMFQLQIEKHLRKTSRRKPLRGKRNQPKTGSRAGRRKSGFKRRK
jgi:hypothetical protein